MQCGTPYCPERGAPNDDTASQELKTQHSTSFISVLVIKSIYIQVLWMSVKTWRIQDTLSSETVATNGPTCGSPDGASPRSYLFAGGLPEHLLTTFHSPPVCCENRDETIDNEYHDLAHYPPMPLEVTFSELTPGTRDRK